MKAIISLLLILFSTKSFAQYESVFGTHSTSWNLFQEYFDGIGTDSLFVVNDTSINTLVYKVIDYLYGEPWFLRETADRSKVFFYSPKLSESEFLLMDLTFEISDTFYIGYIGINRSDTLIVDSVFTKKNKKHVRFNYEIEFAGGIEKFEFIEGVGSNFGLFYQGISLYDISKNHYLLCSYKDNVLCYSNVAFDGQCNNIWSGTKIESSELKIRLFPNPSKGILTISVVDGKNELIEGRIYNSNGILIQTIRKSYLPLIVNLENAPSGLYFFSLHIDNEVINDKFFITK